MTANKIPPKPGKDTIYIDVDDEITAIIDKVEAAKNKVVALVLPKRATMLQSIVNMRLLKRSAEKAAKNVVLITAEEALLPLAGAVGFHVAKNLQSKPEVPTAPAGKSTPADEAPEDVDLGDEEPSTKLDYHRSVGELAGAEEAEAIALDDDDEEPAKEKPAKTKAPKENKLKVPNFDRFRLMVFGGAGLLLLLIIFIILAIFVLPKATIDITTGSVPVNANLNITASDSVKTLDEAKMAIPAMAKTTQQTSTQQVQATGQQNNGTKATGSATMDATRCAPNLGTPDPVSAGTAVSGGGLTYITQQNASFGFASASGSCVTYEAGPVSIAAQTGGTKYNGNFSNGTVSGASGVTASGSASGGTDNIITVVSQSDINGAVSKMTASATDSFTKNFENQLASQGLYVFTSTLKPGTPNTTASPALGQQASNTTVTTTITYTVLAVKKSDFSKLITDALNKQINTSKQRLSNSNVFTDATISVENQSSPSSATISVAEDTTAVPIINTDAIKKQAAGQKVADIKSMVEGQPGVKSVKVDLSPFWISKAPKASKIKIVQDQVKDSGS